MTPDELAQKIRENFPDRGKWFQSHNFSPICFYMMEEQARKVLYEWYQASATDYPHGNGAAGYVTLCTIAGIIQSCGLKSMIQLGHYIGFSSIIFGSVFRHMSAKPGLVSVDLNSEVTEYASNWIQKAGLDEYVHLNVGDSACPDVADAMMTSVEGEKVDAIFIDSSHSYKHTLDELSLWFPKLRHSGFVFLHDVSDYAKRFDALGGGVKPAALEFLDSAGVGGILLNGSTSGPSLYKDPCGLGIFQKK